jgi:SAM-dependent methyltransferase
MNDAERFWEGVYRDSAPTSSGQPNTVLRHLAGDLKPGAALELGCAKGDDAVWLARKGWNVVAVDISATALGYARANAERAGLEDRISFRRHDLARSFPEGRFALVVALFLESSIAFPRPAVLARAADCVLPEGHLLVVEHASRAPWSWAAPETRYPGAEDTLATLALDEHGWARIQVGTIERRATSPGGQTAQVRDNVIFLRRVGNPRCADPTRQTRSTQH